MVKTFAQGLGMVLMGAASVFYLGDLRSFHGSGVHHSFDGCRGARDNG